jgi:hypothetical protein
MSPWPYLRGIGVARLAFLTAPNGFPSSTECIRRRQFNPKPGALNDDPEKDWGYGRDANRYPAVGDARPDAICIHHTKTKVGLTEETMILPELPLASGSNKKIEFEERTRSGNFAVNCAGRSSQFYRNVAAAAVHASFSWPVFERHLRQL